MKNKITICSISDLHGNLPKGKIPKCDLLLIAGDIAPWSRGWNVFDQAYWYNHQFADWIKEQPCEAFFATPGKTFIYTLDH